MFFKTFSKTVKYVQKVVSASKIQFNLIFFPVDVITQFNKELEYGGQINHLVSQLAPMLLVDFTFDKGEDRKKVETKNIVKNNDCSKV